MLALLQRVREARVEVDGVTVGAIGFGTSGGNLSLAPDGTFIVYRVQHGDSAQLWYRSLVDASARPIPGTSNATRPRISPAGTAMSTPSSAAKPP